MSELQPMPILDRLLQRIHEAKRGSTAFEDASDAWGAVKVRADIAAEMYWQSGKERWDRSRDYPPMRLPYPVMWIEWDQPREWKSGRETVSLTHDFEFGMQLGCLLREHAAPDSRVSRMRGPTYYPGGGQPLRGPDEELTVHYPADCTHVFELSPYAMREGRANMFPFTGLIFTDANGNQVKEVEWAGPQEDATARTVEIMSSIYPPALLAVGLMNCKNVGTEVHSAMLGGGRGRRSVFQRQSMKYQTIVVPGHQTSATGNGQESMAARAMHRVRGHFKTFTADAPLMGQHVGTYWWGWQVRGNKDNGVVVSDYKVGAPA